MPATQLAATMAQSLPSPVRHAQHAVVVEGALLELLRVEPRLPDRLHNHFTRDLASTRVAHAGVGQVYLHVANAFELR
jgi:hypothetical protein